MRHKRGFMRPGEGQKWGENGRKRVLQYFTWRKAAEQTLQIYEMLQQKPEHEEARVVDLLER
jgi:glycosyltransferase involved in cell wall biosynthesis